jgi:uncharacterized protein YceK
MRSISLAFCVFYLSGCATPTDYIKSAQLDKINYAYTTTGIQVAKDCIKSKWATRDIKGLLQTYQMTPLIEVPMGDFDRLSWQNLILFDVYRSDGKTVIRESHQVDIHPIWKGVTKDVMMKCSESQKFTNLQDVNENTMSR